MGSGGVAWSCQIPVSHPSAPAPDGHTNCGSVLSPGIPACVLPATMLGVERYSSFVWHVASQTGSLALPGGSHCSVGSTMLLPQTDGGVLRSIVMVNPTWSWFTTSFAHPDATVSWFESFPTAAKTRGVADWFILSVPQNFTPAAQPVLPSAVAAATTGVCGVTPVGCPVVASHAAEVPS